MNSSSPDCHRFCWALGLGDRCPACEPPLLLSFDFARDLTFGFEGEALVAFFGDLAPITAQSIPAPAG